MSVFNIGDRMIASKNFNPNIGGLDSVRPLLDQSHIINMPPCSERNIPKWDGVVMDVNGLVDQRYYARKEMREKYSPRIPEYRSDPNQITIGREPYSLGKKFLADEFNARVKAREEAPLARGRKTLDDPLIEAFKERGRKHYPPQLSEANTVPISIYGNRWDRRRIVKNKDTGVPYNRMASQQYEQNDFYGSIQYYNDPEKMRTYSHKSLLFRSDKDLQRTVDSPSAPEDLHICDEWEKKIISTQGKQQKLVSLQEAFAIDKLRGKDEGTGFFKWATPKPKTPPMNKQDKQINKLKKDIVSLKKDKQILQLKRESLYLQHKKTSLKT